MKRQFLISIIALLTAIAGHAVVVDGVTYEWSNSDDGYIATGWDEETPVKALHILGEVEGLDVVGIASDAFNPAYYTDLPLFESVRIDEGITYIGEDAFVDCSAVKWVRTPSTLLTIGSGAFRRCTSLEYALLNEGLLTIGEEAFAFCSSLTTVVIPSTVIDIQSGAFLYCTNVDDVYFLMTDINVLMDDSEDGFSWWDGPSEFNVSGGGNEFNTNQNTVVHVPAGMLQHYVNSEKFTAWLPLEEDTDNCYPLWWIVNFGVVGRSYTVCDDLLAVYTDVNGDLYAKDDNHWLTPDIVNQGEFDYMSTTGLMNNKNNIYDQSNWVELKNVDPLETYDGYFINGSSITGVLVDKKNPVIEVSSEATLRKKGPQTHYVENTYLPAAFMGRTQVGTDDVIYAFVQPKPQELMRVDWTIYCYDDGNFYLPEPDEGVNSGKIAGGFQVCYDLYENKPVPTLVDGGYYPFEAINRIIVPEDYQGAPRGFRKVQSWSPYVDGGFSDDFMVYPLDLPSDPIHTGITSVFKNTIIKDGWYTTDGRFLGFTIPAIPGVYIKGDKKVVIR